MDKREYISTLLPHKKPMILIDEIIDYSIKGGWLKSAVTIRPDSVFFDSDINGIDSAIGMEYMAQSIGCYVYIKQKTKKPKIGFLLGTRLYNSSIPYFENGKTYYIMVREVFVTEICSFSCCIYNDDNEEIASATLNVYQSSKHNMKGMSNE